MSNKWTVPQEKRRKWGEVKSIHGKHRLTIPVPHCTRVISNKRGMRQVAALIHPHVRQVRIHEACDTLCLHLWGFCMERLFALTLWSFKSIQTFKYSVSNHRKDTVLQYYEDQSMNDVLRNNYCCCWLHKQKSLCFKELHVFMDASMLSISLCKYRKNFQAASKCSVNSSWIHPTVANL
jgi:hypothetical protein